FDYAARLPVLGPAMPSASLSPLALVSGDPGVLEITGDVGDNTYRLVMDPANSDQLDVFINNTSDVPDQTVEADAIQKVIVTGSDGNDTLTVDDANGLVHFDEGIQFDGGLGTNTQQEINDTPISGGIVAKIKNGLSELAEWSKKLADFAQL